MFPEGTRNKNPEKLLPFKKGAFRVAIVCQIPVIPVVYSPYYFINSKKAYFGRGKEFIIHFIICISKVKAFRVKTMLDEGTKF